MQAGSRHLSVGVGTLSRVFENMTLHCPENRYGRVEAHVRNVSLTLSMWHPFSAALVLQGGETIENISATSRIVLARAEGAPLTVHLPLWSSRPMQAVTFTSEALRLSAWQAAGHTQAVFLQNMQGTLVWNAQAQAQSSMIALKVSANGLGSTFWKESAANVTLAIAVPGPITERHALWSAWVGQPYARADVAVHAASSPAATPDILVQHVGATWRGVSVAWSARLWFLPSEGLVGESWLTLPDWRTTLDAVHTEKYLTPEQQNALLTFRERLVQRHSLMDGPLTVPLPVRGSQLVMGPCRMGMQSLNCSGLF